MTGFDVWLWLKLDAISGLVWALGFAILILACTGQIAARLWRAELPRNPNPNDITWANGVLLKSWVWAVVGVILVVAGVLCPSTKQYAVIKILPQVANSKFVSEELPADAKEMYDTFKAWTKEQMRAPEEAEPVKGGE